MLGIFTYFSISLS